MSEINPETGVSEIGGSPRFTTWAAFLLFSTITMGSSIELNNKYDVNNDNPNAKYAIASSAITFAVTLMVVVSHFFPVASSLCIGTPFEGIIILISALLWGAIVAVVTNASSGLSVSTDGINTVQNGNLYYFSWAGFVTSIILLVSYMRQIFGVDLVGQVKNRATRLSLWAGMFASALVVMGACSRILITTCKGQGSTSICKRTEYGVSVGTIGVVFSIGVVGMKFLSETAPLEVEFGLAAILTVLNAFCVAYTTSPDGPGSSIGNLYYFSWFSFLLSAMLSVECYNQHTAAVNQQPEQNETEVEVVQNFNDDNL